MKVIDASVGFKALVTEADSAKAIQLVAGYRDGVTERTSTPLRSPIVSREPSGKAALLRSKEQNSLQPCFRICPVSYLRWRFCQKPTLSHRRCELASTTVSTWHSPSSMADRLIRTLQGKYHPCACVDLMYNLRPNGDSHVVRGSPSLLQRLPLIHARHYPIHRRIASVRLTVYTTPRRMPGLRRGHAVSLVQACAVRMRRTFPLSNSPAAWRERLGLGFVAGGAVLLC